MLTRLFVLLAPWQLWLRNMKAFFFHRLRKIIGKEEGRAEGRRKEWRKEGMDWIDVWKEGKRGEEGKEQLTTTVDGSTGLAGAELAGLVTSVGAAAVAAHGFGGRATAASSGSTALVLEILKGSMCVSQSGFLNGVWFTLSKKRKKRYQQITETWLKKVEGLWKGKLTRQHSVPPQI